MSKQNIDMVRAAYDVAYNERSVAGVREQFAEDFVWHSRPEWPGRRTYGMDEMPEIWADLDDTYSEFELAPTAFEEVGDGYVLVTLQQSARLRGSATRINSATWHLWRVEEMPREAWAFGTRDAALQAAGVAE